jgi:aspartate aminotransferase
MALLADNAQRMPRSGIREIMDLAWRLPGPVIGLHVGEPSFATPEHVLDGARRALDRGDTRYVANAGIPTLREAIADKLAARNGLGAQPEQVVVSAGGMQALYTALSATVTAGAEVLVPDPGWPNFAMAVQLLQARPVGYPLRAENRFLPDVEELAQLVTERTRALILNFPSNPLGAVLPADLAQALCRFADRHDLWLISDECYDEITFGAEQVSPARWDEQDRVLSCFSFSKTYAMTGMRVGYLVAPKTVAATAAKMQEPLISCVNAPAQHAALAALEGPQDFVAMMRRAYHERRDGAAAQLDRAGIGYLLPQGAF